MFLGIDPFGGEWTSAAIGVVRDLVEAADTTAVVRSRSEANNNEEVEIKEGDLILTFKPENDKENEEDKQIRRKRIGFIKNRRKISVSQLLVETGYAERPVPVEAASVEEENNLTDAETAEDSFSDSDSFHTAEEVNLFAIRIVETYNCLLLSSRKRNLRSRRTTSTSIPPARSLTLALRCPPDKPPTARYGGHCLR